MPKSITKLQHYLPKSYLSRFFDRDGKTFCVYDKETLLFARRTPKTFGAETHLYTTIDLSGNATDAMETEFLQKIDDMGKPLLDAIRDGRALSNDEEKQLALFVAVMQVRTPSHIQFSQELAQAVVEHHLRKQGDEVAILDVAERIGVTPDEVRKMMSDPTKYLGITANRKLAMLRSIDRCWQVADELLSMRRKTLRLDKPKLITGDAPVVSVVSRGGKMRPGGLRESGVEITFAVDPKTCIHYSREDVAMPNHSYQLNRRVAWSADRYLVASKRSKDTLALTKESAVTCGLPKAGKEDAFKILDEMDQRERKESR